MKDFYFVVLFCSSVIARFTACTSAFSGDNPSRTGGPGSLRHSLPGRCVFRVLSEPEVWVCGAARRVMMSFRRAVRFVCGFAGGSAVVVACAYLADKHREGVRFKPALSGALWAAQPSAGQHSHSWDYNWDK